MLRLKNQKKKGTYASPRLYLTKKDLRKALKEECRYLKLIANRIALKKIVRSKIEVKVLLKTCIGKWERVKIKVKQNSWGLEKTKRRIIKIKSTLNKT